MTRVNQLIKEALLSKDNKLDAISQVREEYTRASEYTLIKSK